MVLTKGALRSWSCRGHVISCDVGSALSLELQHDYFEFTTPLYVALVSLIWLSRGLIVFGSDVELTTFAFAMNPV